MKKVKVLILNPPSPNNKYINRDQMGGMGQKIDFDKDFKAGILSKLKSNFIHLPVVQLVYAATVLAENDFDVKVIDALNENIRLNKMFNSLNEFSPDFLLMSISASCLLFERDVVAKQFRERFPQIKIITVGDALTYATDQFKQPFDVAIIGEVEQVIVDICTLKDLSAMQGVIYYSNGKVVKNVNRKKLTSAELDKLPFPRWEFFPYKKYVYYPLLMQTPVATVQSSRGCPYGCGYCPYPANQGLEWRSRTAENIVAEIEQDVNTYGFRGIAFRDPLFTLDARRVNAICDLLLQRKLQVVFSLETRPELLTRELLGKLYAAGCRAINLGIEDIHPEVLKLINRKPIQIENVVDIVNYAEQLGIRTTCFFIIGLPGSTRQTIKETIEFSHKLNTSHADYKIATPFPGTFLYELAKNNNWIVQENYNKLSGYSALIRISEELSPEFLEKTCSNAFNKFYIRPDYFLKEWRKGDILKKIRIILKSLFVF